MGAVSLITFTLLYGVVYLAIFLGDKWIEKVTDGDYRDFMGAEVWDIFYDTLRPVLQTDSIVRFMFLFLSSIFFLVFCVVVGLDSKFQDITYIEAISNIATKLAPIMSWVGSTSLLLLIVHWGTKKGYALCKAVKDLQDKAK